MRSAAAFVSVAVVAFTLAATPPAYGQQASVAAPPTYESQVRSMWRALNNKILAMAKDTLFPIDKLDARPHPDSRSVLEEFRHLTLAIEWSRAELRGERFDYGARTRADAEKPRTRESVVRDMEAAMAASFATLDSTSSPRMVYWLEHHGEHYGKLVTEYRVLGIVPPASRRRN